MAQAGALPEETGGSARTITMLALLLTMLLLAGCGFSPMYAERAADGAALHGWEQVDVAPPADRLTQLVYNELLQNRPPAQRGNRPYVLTMKVAEEEADLLGDRLQRIRVKAEFALMRRTDGRVLMQGRTYGDASYHTTRLHLADAQARAAAMKTAARLVAEDIRTRISAYFARTATNAPGTSTLAFGPPAPAATSR